LRCCHSHCCCCPSCRCYHRWFCRPKLTPYRCWVGIFGMPGAPVWENFDVSRFWLKIFGVSRFRLKKTSHVTIDWLNQKAWAN
jgi:hypothetical protein